MYSLSLLTLALSFPLFSPPPPLPPGRTAVHWAAMVNFVVALKLLIRQGPDTIKDTQDNKVCVGSWQPAEHTHTGLDC